MSTNVAVEVYFQHNADRLDVESLAKLEQILCRVGDNQVEVAIVVGHASADEANPIQLSDRRTQKVLQWFDQHTHWGKRIYAESKAATQPVADQRLKFERPKNRRVELDVLLLPKLEKMAAKNVCVSLWQSTLLADTATAPTVARALVNSGELSAEAPFLAALDAKRLDIFDALTVHSGITLNEEQRTVIALRALDQLRLDYFERWIKTDGLVATPIEGDWLLRRVCNSDAPTAEKVHLLDVLREAGARVSSTDTMRCVLTRDVSPLVLDALVRAGGKLFVDTDLLVASGERPQMMEGLLALGLEPNVRDSRGTSLFHTVRLDSTASVQRLLDWGLDINARAPVSSRYRSDPEDTVTPLYLAQSACCIKVLDYMKAHGARVEDAGPFIDNNGRIAVQRWFVENGIPITRENVVRLASGAGRLPVFEALLARGIDLSAPNVEGDTALGRAIDGYEVELVQFLVQRARVGLGASRSYRGDNFNSALERAHQLTALEYPPIYVHGYNPDPRPAGTHNALLQTKKDEIIAIIESAKRP